MKKVLLEGFLGEKYGREWEIAGTSYAHIFGCIEANYPEFRADLIDYAEKGGGLSILAGSDLLEDPDELSLPIEHDTIVITPVPEGSKSGGAKLLIGALIIASFFFLPGGAGLAFGASMAQGGGLSIAAYMAGGASLAGASTLSLLVLGLGVNLAMVGLQQLLAPDPSVDTNDQNYLFNAPENTVASGNPVPILCGEMIIGGFLMSTAIVPGLPTSSGHVGGIPTGGSGGIGIPSLPGGASGGFGGNLLGDFVDPTSDRVGTGNDIVIADSGLHNIDDDLFLYSENTYSKPWIARAPKSGVSYIVPVVPHEIPAELLDSHRTSVTKALYSDEVLWDEQENITIGTLPFNAVLYKNLDGISVEAIADFAGTATVGSFSNVLDSISISTEGVVTVIGNVDYTLDGLGFASTATYSGVSEIAGDLIKTLDSISISSAGQAEYIGEATNTLADITSASEGTNTYIHLGDLTASLADLGISSDGQIHFLGAASNTLADISITSAGTFETASGYETESEALFAEFNTDPGSTRKGHINTAIATLISEGVWSKLRSLQVYAGHADTGDVRIDWKDPTRVASIVGTGPNFNTNGPLGAAASADTNYLLTNVNGNTLGLNTSCHAGLFVEDYGWYKRSAQVNHATEGWLADYFGDEAGVGVGRIKGSATANFGGSLATMNHLCLVDNGTNTTAYRDGTSITSVTRGTGNNVGPWRILADGSTGENSIFVYAFHFGENISAAEVDVINDTIRTYLTAIGAI